ncbi:phosphate ABC transporter permease subunit PstC, partial [Staphylococcus warneri]
MKSQHNVREMIHNKSKVGSSKSDKIMPIILATIAAISILTTIGIVITLLTETITFFTRVPMSKFFLETDWNPFSANPKYGIWALILGTLKITLIATIFAVPVGLGAA